MESQRERERERDDRGAIKEVSVLLTENGNGPRMWVGKGRCDYLIDATRGELSEDVDLSLIHI